MRRRRVLSVVFVVVAIGAMAVVRPGTGAVPTATLVGYLAPPGTYLDNGYSMLDRIDFRSTGTVANDLVFTEVTAGIASAQCVGVTTCTNYQVSATDSFVDASGDLGAATGGCHLVARGVGACSSVFPPGLYQDLQLGAVDHFQINVALGAGNDRFVAERPISPVLNFRYLELDVDGGLGNDTVIALDSSYFKPGSFQEEPLGLDRVDCGPGIDRAVVSPSVTTTNCEAVSVLKQIELWH